ncbi:Holliday junction branch migration protein RuvA [Thermosulfurimonas sp. F29]|uniref:Holliday junction branch migration protein RuvA n=1 Tax=Thermosulfurimonas sp. F29 TaxID=2867247 RepID=UPI001C82BDDB|nr:Holliday junction branch migration protein RuvA [Thermosulfurimonas sp. F29]MBX6422513.1 Holliday junction branch migration protein RuvA [Thermosulfurimonas sp. F29]
MIRKIPGKVWLEVGALVFEVTVPFTLTEKLPAPGQVLRLPICLWIQEGVPELFGFADEESRDTFRLLASLSGVGPRLALNILALFRPEELEEAVRSEDVEALSRVPGIGPRRAEKLCVELRGRLALRKKDRPRPPLYEEALRILRHLGFPVTEAEKALSEVYTGEEDLDALLREALKRLSPV